MSHKINLVFLLTLFLYSLYCALQLGPSWDVLFNYNLGKIRLNYLLGLGFKDIEETAYVHKFYTGAYSTISAFFVQLFPKKYLLQSLYIINLIFSSLTIFGVYKITKELFNKRIGQIAFLLCYFNPIFFGHMAMNSMDTIIAFANIWFFYKIILYVKNQQNEKKNKYLIHAALLFGLGLGVRYSFIVTLVPILLFVLLEISHFKIIINKDFSKKTFFFDSLKVVAIAYAFMVLFWPETHKNIFILPFKFALESFSYGFGPPLILFQEKIFETSTLPKYYFLINLFYKTPEFIILSFILFIFFFFKINSHLSKKIKGFNFKVAFIIIIILFPNILFLISPYAVYDGIRLLLYVLPYICIISAILIFFLYEKIKINLYKLIFGLIIIFQLFFLFNFFSLTPYHYVYLNIFLGKYSDNSKIFENDYWGVSTKKLISSIEKKNEILKDTKVKIATCGVEKNAQKNYFKKINNFDFKMVNSNENYDYIIMNNRALWNLNINEIDKKTPKTCFEKFSGVDIAKIERRGLILSKITKNYNY